MMNTNAVYPTIRVKGMPRRPVATKYQADFSRYTFRIDNQHSLIGGCGFVASTVGRNAENFLLVASVSVPW